MIWCRPVQDRRGEHRPANGDRKRCPRCGTQSLEFNDRYRLTGPTGAVASMPAWACDRPGCGFTELVRRPAGHQRQRQSRRMARATLRPTVRKKSG